jgi:hypothetical protein
VILSSSALKSDWVAQRARTHFFSMCLQSVRQIVGPMCNELTSCDGGNSQ